MFFQNRNFILIFKIGIIIGKNKDFQGKILLKNTLIFFKHKSTEDKMYFEIPREALKSNESK